LKFDPDQRLIRDPFQHLHRIFEGMITPADYVRFTPKSGHSPLYSFTSSATDGANAESPVAVVRSLRSSLRCNGNSK
jgi:hypothetical protein